MNEFIDGLFLIHKTNSTLTTRKGLVIGRKFETHRGGFWSKKYDKGWRTNFPSCLSPIQTLECNKINEFILWVSNSRCFYEYPTFAYQHPQTLYVSMIWIRISAFKNIRRNRKINLIQSNLSNLVRFDFLGVGLTLIPKYWKPTSPIWFRIATDIVSDFMYSDYLL